MMPFKSMKLMEDIEELSEEDQQLKSELEMLVERLKVCLILSSITGDLIDDHLIF